MIRIKDEIHKTISDIQIHTSNENQDVRALFLTHLEELLELYRTSLADSVVVAGLEPIPGKKLTLFELQNIEWFCSDASDASVDTLIMMGISVFGRENKTKENTLLLKSTEHNAVRKFEIGEQINGSVLLALGVPEIERKEYDFYWL